MANWDMRAKAGKTKVAYWDNSEGIKELESAGEIEKKEQGSRTIAFIL